MHLFDPLKVGTHVGSGKGKYNKIIELWIDNVFGGIFHVFIESFYMLYKSFAQQNNRKLAILISLKRRYNIVSVFGSIFTRNI